MGSTRLSEDVDIIVSSDSLGGGYVVNNFETGEWLAYAINVAASGNYDIELRASSAISTSAFHVEIDGTDVTGPITANTGSWDNFQWVGARGVALTAGIHVLKIVADQQYFNLNSIRVNATSTSTPPGSTAQLLFRSGFEGTVAIGAPTNCFTTGCWQAIVGTDSVTGYSWPPAIWGGGGNFQMIVDAAVTASTVGNYMTNQIQTVTGHNGNQTRALYNAITQSGCCGTNSQGGGATQDPYILLPQNESGDLYISYWIKFQPDLVQKQTPQTWRVLFEWKTQGDYRVIAQVVTYGGTPWWQIVGDNNANGGLAYQRFWEVQNLTVPVPIGEWFKYEVFWHRSTGNDGRVWMAANGQVIADHYGPNVGVNGAAINRIMMPNLYSGGSYPIYQWMDDVEIWNGFPPQNGNNPPYAPH